MIDRLMTDDGTEISIPPFDSDGAGSDVLADGNDGIRPDFRYRAGGRPGWVDQISQQVSGMAPRATPQRCVAGLGREKDR